VPAVVGVLVYSSLAAAAAALGVVPLLRRPALPTHWLGWANAAAAGLMLGAAWLLLDAGLHSVLPAGAGALLGIVFVYSSQAMSRTSDLGLNRLDSPAAEYTAAVELRSTLHSAAEGVAIGGSMVVRVELGIFMALALAVHNVPEGMLLAVVHRARGTGAVVTALRAVAVNASQVALAVIAYLLAVAWPALLPWTLGFAAGALIYLVMVELLPESYHQVGHTSIADLTSLAIGAVVLLAHLTSG
jgi:zinc transporter ZupT